MQFKFWIKSNRKAKNVSQQKLADELNISRSVIAKWETGCVFPTDENLNVLANYFNANIDDLLIYKSSSENYINSNREILKKWIKAIRRTYLVSFMRKGLIGGSLYLGEFTITYKTNKLTIPKEYRYFEIAFSEIMNIEYGKFLFFSTITIQIENKEEFKFLIYRRKHLKKALDLRHELVKDI